MKHPNIIVVGQSGHGKSSSLRNLNPLTTAIIIPECKVLPFQNASKFLHQVETTDMQGLNTAWAKFNTMKEIEVIVIDSFSAYQRQILSFCRGAYKDWDIWSNHNKILAGILQITKRSEKFVVWLAIDEVIEKVTASGSKRTQRAVKVDGKELFGAVESEFTICLFCDCRDINGKTVYRFQTNTDTTDSAKTPMGMFNEQYIDNDLNLVIQRCKEYYGR